VSTQSKILLVEDNPGDVELLKLALRDVGIECDLTVIEDGGEAIALVQGAQQPPVDLAIVDLNVPKSDGLEILAAMRRNPMFDRVPVVILTTSASPRDRSRMEAFGIDRYLSKPYDLEEYLGIGQAIKQLLETRKPHEASQGAGALSD
jgi:two-component system response regulator